jgi:hypothetical protein
MTRAIDTRRVDIRSCDTPRHQYRVHAGYVFKSLLAHKRVESMMHGDVRR